MSRLPISDAWAEPAYRRVNSEEGAYDAFCGYNLLARVRTKDGYVETYLYTNGDEDGAAYVFPNQQQADLCTHLVKSKGSIDAEALWLCVGCADPDALPDYVTDPYRAEFN